MLPWGTDETWVDHVSFDDDGLLFGECMADTQPAPRSTASLCGCHSATASTASISRTRAVLSPPRLRPGCAGEPAKSSRRMLRWRCRPVRFLADGAATTTATATVPMPPGSGPWRLPRLVSTDPGVSWSRQRLTRWPYAVPVRHEGAENPRWSPIPGPAPTFTAAPAAPRVRPRPWLQPGSIPPTAATTTATARSRRHATRCPATRWRSPRPAAGPVVAGDGSYSAMTTPPPPARRRDRRDHRKRRQLTDLPLRRGAKHRLRVHLPATSRLAPAPFAGDQGRCTRGRRFLGIRNPAAAERRRRGRIPRPGRLSSPMGEKFARRTWASRSRRASARCGLHSAVAGFGVEQECDFGQARRGGCIAFIEACTPSVAPWRFEGGAVDGRRPRLWRGSRPQPYECGGPVGAARPEKVRSTSRARSGRARRVGIRLHRCTTLTSGSLTKRLAFP